MKDPQTIALMQKYAAAGLAKHPREIAEKLNEGQNSPQEGRREVDCTPRGNVSW